ncbi:S-adenosyl-L-methionine-dependent methyltransferase [Mycena latifolia]|nr:S-adenosyl-L-methionine-dependent methyltransferase [Mycena latifolia]
MPREASSREGTLLACSRQAAQKARKSASAVNNPLFNTERFGQHILKNPAISQEIVDAAQLKATDQVLEIGPGTGNLTVRHGILEVARNVTAIEMDPQMAAELAKRVQGMPAQKRLQIVVGDFVKAELPYFDQEFARRLVAQPGSPLWSRLSANVQLYAKVDHLRDVKRNNFRPAPQVENSVVRLVPRDPPPTVKFEEFDGLTRGTFLHSGVISMLEINWRVWCSVNETMIDGTIDFNVSTLIEDTGFSEQRAVKMSVDDLLALLLAFHDKGIHFA